MNHVDDLEPVDDVMGRLTAKYGQTNEAVEYLARSKGHWLAVPSSSGTQMKGPCGRISILKDAAGIDVVAMFPGQAGHAAGRRGVDLGCPPEGRRGLRQGRQAVRHRARHDVRFGRYRRLRCSPPTAPNWSTPRATITVKSDAVRQVLEYAQRLVKVLPKDAVSYDDASNNRALISGQSALIWNPPSAWAVAKRDAPAVAAECWTFPAPCRPEGALRALPAVLLGRSGRSAQNKTAAKELIEYLMQREQVEARCNAVVGYDIPPFDSMLDFKVWETVEPPKGTVYNYPIRPAAQGESRTSPPCRRRRKSRCRSTTGAPCRR